MQLLAATVSKAPRQVSTKYGQRLVCDVTLPDGSESAIWGPVGYAPIEYLEQGQAVTVSKDSKGKVSIIENHLTHPGMEAPAIKKAEPTEEGLSPDIKRQIAAHIRQQAAVYGYCLQQAAGIPGLPERDVRNVATTLFIDACKKFDL